MAKKAVDTKPKKPKKKKPNLLRITVAALMFFIQAGLLMFGIIYMNIAALITFVFLHIVAAVFTISIVYSERNSSFKLLWVVVVMAIPGLGIILYLFWGLPRPPRRIAKTMPLGSDLRIAEAPPCTAEKRLENVKALGEEYPNQEKIAGYLERSGYPVYPGQDVKYYGLGDELFPDMMDAIKKAKKFVFIETFILSEGTLWNDLYKLLCQKAEEGVDVRLLYDDFGSIFALPWKFGKLKSRPNLQVAEFNRFIPFISSIYIGNHRNHQKLCVVDGRVAFTGGVNIADEYANLVDAYGQWKDSGMRLRGDGVWSMTVMFLQMWTYANSRKRKDPENFLDFYVPADGGIEDKAAEERVPSYALPISDGPYGKGPNRPAEFLYLQMINRARRYIYISTPYLILDNEMSTALCMAAYSGVDVRIVTPGIPDKKYVYPVTRYYYGRLLKAGVRVYEYEPGFIHAKNIVSDDETALVGTINVDFRSFYLHFEDAIWTCGGTAVKEVKKDFDETIEVSREISLEEWESRPWWYKVVQALLRLISPLF